MRERGRFWKRYTSSNAVKRCDKIRSGGLRNSFLDWMFCDNNKPPPDNGKADPAMRALLVGLLLGFGKSGCVRRDRHFLAPGGYYFVYVSLLHYYTHTPKYIMYIVSRVTPTCFFIKIVVVVLLSLRSQSALTNDWSDPAPRLRVLRSASPCTPPQQDVSCLVSNVFLFSFCISC